MSDLKHKTTEELLQAKRECENKIAYHSSQLAGQKERLAWIERYLRLHDAFRQAIESLFKEPTMADLTRIEFPKDKSAFGFAQEGIRVFLSRTES